MVIFHYFFVQRNRGRRRVPTKARSRRGAPRKVRGRRRAPTKVSGVGAECRQRSGLGAGRQEKLENKKNMSVITSLYTQVYSNLLVYYTRLSRVSERYLFILAFWIVRIFNRLQPIFKIILWIVASVGELLFWVSTYTFCSVTSSKIVVENF